MLTDAFPPEAVRIGAQAAVVGIGAGCALAGAGALAFPVEGIATLAALEQTLQQIQCSTACLPRMTLILAQSLPDGRKHLGLHERPYGNGEPVLAGDVHLRDRPSRTPGPATGRAQ